MLPKKWSKKSCIGSFTIEAAYIMPLLVFIILAVVYITIYLHNLTLFQSRMNQAILTAEEVFTYECNPYSGRIDYNSILNRDITSIFSGVSDKKKLLLTEYLNEINREGYIYSHIEGLSISDSMTKISISAEMVMDISIPDMFTALYDKLKVTKLTRCRSIPGREEKQRIYSVIKDTVIQIKGVEEILEKVKNLLSGYK